MLDLSLQMGERSGELMANGTLSLVAWLQGETQQTFSLNERVLTLASSFNHPLGRIHGLIVKNLLTLMHDPEHALTLFKQCDELSMPGLIRFFCDLGMAIAFCNTLAIPQLRLHLHNALTYAFTSNSAGLMALCLPLGALLMHHTGKKRDAGMLAVLVQQNHKQLIGVWLSLNITRRMELEALDTSLPDPTFTLEQAGYFRA
jgi:hypothetical protein